MSAVGGRVDLLRLTAELVDTPSVSHGEGALADLVERHLSRLAEHLELARIGDNVCARTRLGLPMRLVLAGHLDTVPPNGNEVAIIEGDVCYGIGAADMKGGDAVFLELARLACEKDATERLRTDLTFIFYVCEEVERRFSGLVEIEAADRSWLEGDAAILGEPTAAVVEAGCQGTLKATVELRGERAHTARPFMGVNAIHRLAKLLAAVDSYEARRPVLDGCEYREAVQAVAVEGGVAGNVVPDLARVVLNHRFAPDRSTDEAFGWLKELLASSVDEEKGDRVVLEDFADPAPPGLTHPLLARLVEATGRPPRAKLGWTDASFFAARGVPAANFGPGEPTLAHNAGERVTREELESSLSALCQIVGLLATSPGKKGSS